MNILAKAWFWALDYAYVGIRQLDAGPSRAALARYRSGDSAPVVLLPGIYETWRFLRPLADALHGSGHPVHAIRGLGRNRRPVADGARIAAEYLSQEDLHGVILVAHSKGGLIGKYLMMSAAGRERIDRMVAIATPFSGSSLAKYTVLPSLRALSPTDPMVRLLVDEQFVNARITSVYGAFDPHIPDGCSLPGATNIALAASGHFRIIGDRGLITAVSAACGGDGKVGSPHE
ncbi:esterase/lipase family protein [Cryobacterium tagatosivorans]|uniref:Alpha/beta hydrolase n=1 Tax=Cryobacterium tagatosivorans TaxID=1259199 RepID=A0A4R8UEK4_9MICO|nr:alpha/beta hydrolase [Cryobacterium tagatosivorans]TFB49512.1 alpha/beta hydrolase [Cryobacterium tagatosivorans]